METLFLIGRIVFSLIFIGSGIGHLAQTEGSAQYAAAKGLSSPKLMVQLSGVAMLAGGIGIILGIWMDLAAWGMAVLMILMAVLMHRFWEESDPQAQQTEMSMFMKNLSIAGGALVIASVADGAPNTITDALF